jgi:hypothetical protein
MMTVDEDEDMERVENGDGGWSSQGESEYRGMLGGGSGNNDDTRSDSLPFVDGRQLSTSQPISGDNDDDDDDGTPRHSFRAVASVAVIAASMRAKVNALLTTSSCGGSASGGSGGASEGDERPRWYISSVVGSHSPEAAAEPWPGPEPQLEPTTPRTAMTESGGFEVGGAGIDQPADPHPLARSVSDLLQTETWLDQAIAAADSSRRENEDLRRRLAEAVRLAADAAEDAAVAECERDRAEVALGSVTDHLRGEVEAAVAAAEEAEVGAAAAVTRGDQAEEEVAVLRGRLQSQRDDAEECAAASEVRVVAAEARVDALRAALVEAESTATVARCRLSDIEEDARRTAAMYSERNTAASTELTRLTRVMATHASDLEASTEAREVAEAAASARGNEVREAKARARDLQAERHVIEAAASEASAARAAAECVAAEARNAAAEARAEARQEAASCAAAHEARRRAEAEMAAISAAHTDPPPSPPADSCTPIQVPLTLQQRWGMQEVTTTTSRAEKTFRGHAVDMEDAATNTTPRALPAPPSSWLPVVPGPARTTAASETAALTANAAGVVVASPLATASPALAPAPSSMVSPRSGGGGDDGALDRGLEGGCSLDSAHQISTPQTISGGGGKFAAALRAYTERLRDDVARAEAEVSAHRTHADRMQREIARLASDLPSARARTNQRERGQSAGEEETEAHTAKGADVAQSSREAVAVSGGRTQLSVSMLETTTTVAETEETNQSVFAAAAGAAAHPHARQGLDTATEGVDGNRALGGGADGGKAETRAESRVETRAETKAVYYKAIAKKCYQRMKLSKEAYELQLTGLRQQLEIAGGSGSVNLNNLSFSSTLPPGSPARTLGGAGKSRGGQQRQRGQGLRRGEAPAFTLPSSPDVDDASLLLDEHF